MAVAVPAPASAVVLGQPDGDGHPNVGMVAIFDASGLAGICSGTLVAPSTVHTAAQGVSEDAPSPAEGQQERPDLRPEAGAARADQQHGGPRTHTGTAQRRPPWEGGGVALTGEEVDIGLGDLNSSQLDRTRASRPSTDRRGSALDGWARARGRVTQVGYGVQIDFRSYNSPQFSTAAETRRVPVRCRETSALTTPPTGLARLRAPAWRSASPRCFNGVVGVGSLLVGSAPATPRRRRAGGPAPAAGPRPAPPAPRRGSRG